MANTRTGAEHPGENPSTAAPSSESKSSQQSFGRSQHGWQRNIRRPATFLFYVGTAAASYLTYRSIRDWYYDFPITVGGSPPTSRNFVKTKNYLALQEKLKRGYREKTNLIVVVGEQGGAIVKCCVR